MSLSSLGYRGKFVAVKTAKKRKVSSNRWLQRQLNDPYVAKAKIDNYRSRAAYKLLEIHEKFKLFTLGMKVVDLGAAPGSWSQVTAKIIKSDEGANDSKIIAVDLLNMESIIGVHCVQKDLFDHDAQQMIMETLGTQADVVMSDMAANMTGHAVTDHIRTLTLCEYAFEFALRILKPGGHFIAKIFRGGTESNLLTKVKLNFHVVKHFKPSSSRKESTEFYLIALDRKHVLNL